MVLLNLGPLGWILSFVVGFAVGGLYFLSIKAQVEYIVKRKGPEWLVPAGLYARVIFLGVLLVLVGSLLPREKLGGAVLAGLAGSIVARVLVGRMVRRSS